MPAASCTVKARYFNSRDIWKTWGFLPISLNCEASEAVTTAFENPMEGEMLGAPVWQPSWVGASWALDKVSPARGGHGGEGARAVQNHLAVWHRGGTQRQWPFIVVLVFLELLEDPVAGTSTGGLRSFGWERRRAALQKQKLCFSVMHRSSQACSFTWVQRGGLVPSVIASTPVSSPHRGAQVGQCHSQPWWCWKKEKCIDSLPGNF